MNPMPSPEMDAYRLMKTCPRFRTCSAPACPLDLRQSVRPVYPGEPVCRLSKRIRRGLAKGTALPHGGLTGREAEGEKRWQGKTEEERHAVLERLAKTGFTRPGPDGGDIA